MIEEVLITDLSTAVSTSFKDCKQNAWLCVVDDEDAKKVRILRNNFKKAGKMFFSKLFYDWSDEDKDLFIVKNIETLGPTKESIQSILRYLHSLQESSKPFYLGINCYAGISRSTALGIAALVISGKTPKMALDYILSIRPFASPNLRILRLVSEILNQDLETPVQEYKKAKENKLYKGGYLW
jgi:predicted protein tyrosine phosphatase